MADLRINKIDETLKAQLKAQAALSRKLMRQLIVEALAKLVKQGAK